MDRILELLARIAELTAEELAELNTLIAAEADRLEGEERSQENVEQLGTLADAADQARNEEGRREQEQSARDEAAEAALARIRPAAAQEGEDGTEGAEGQEGQDPPEGEEGAEGQEAGQPAAVAAAATPAAPRRPSLGELSAHRPARATPRRAEGEQASARRSRVRAAANVHGFTAGQEITTREQLADAFTAQLRSMGSGGGGEFVHVAQALYDFPEDRRLGNNGPANERRVNAVTSPEALVAAGGLCAPPENVYDVPVIGSTARPVRDALPSFQASRGGVSLRGPSTFTSLSGGVGTWTMTQDTTPGTDTKAIVDAICSSFTDYFVDATTLRIRFSNVTSRFDPEMTRANVEMADIAYAQYAENKLLGQIRAFLKPLTAPKVVGATPDLLASVDRVIAYYRSRRRLDQAVRFRAVFPLWALDLMRADMTRGMRTSNLDTLALADQQIQAWFDRRNINITWTLDGRTSAQSAVTGPPAVPAIGAQVYASATIGAAIPEFPDTVEWLLWVEGDVLYLDGGELDLGLVRDSTLNAQNRYEMFREEFNGVAWRGLEGFQIVSTVDPTGGSAGTVDTSAVSD